MLAKVRKTMEYERAKEEREAMRASPLFFLGKTTKTVSLWKNGRSVISPTPFNYPANLADLQLYRQLVKPMKYYENNVDKRED